MLDERSKVVSDRIGPTSADDVTRIIESAQRLGVEMDEGEALQWLTAIASWQSGGDVEPGRFVAQGHFGLAGMRERATMIGAELDVQTAVEYGTVVILELPR